MAIVTRLDHSRSPGSFRPRSPSSPLVIPAPRPVRPLVLDVGSGVQAIMDDDQLRTDCHRGDQPRHDHRGEITDGHTPYVKRLITRSTPGRPGQPQAFALLGLELPGSNHADVDILELERGEGFRATPASPINRWSGGSVHRHRNVTCLLTHRGVSVRFMPGPIRFGPSHLQEATFPG